MHQATVLSCRYLGAHNSFPMDSFGSGETSLRVIGHSDDVKAALWSLVEHPLDHDAKALMLALSFDPSSAYVASWYLAIPDDPDAKRDHTSMYLSVTSAPHRAAVVHVVNA